MDGLSDIALQGGIATIILVIVLDKVFSIIKFVMEKKHNNNNNNNTINTYRPLQPDLCKEHHKQIHESLKEIKEILKR